MLSNTFRTARRVNLSPIFARHGSSRSSRLLRSPVLPTSANRFSTSTMSRSEPSRSSVPPFRLTPPTEAEEAAHLAAQTAACESFMSSPRFAQTRRPYPPSLVATKRGTQPPNPLHPANVSAQKLFALLSAAAREGRAVSTLGAIDPVQQSQMAAHQEVVYVSGWATSSVLTVGNEVGPDLADYVYLSVPNQVERLRKAQELHDRKMWDERTAGDKTKQPWVDYLRPIIADGDTGHGGLSSVMKLAKAFGEAGVSAVHFEDQLHGGKKCGHQGGKVLVPMSEHVSRLIAARMQWDIMGIETLLIARTDAESANLISSTIDGRDHQFVLGVESTGEDVAGLAESIARAEREGASGEEINKIEEDWTAANELVTFDEAVKRHLTRNASVDEASAKFEAYQSRVAGANLTNREARKVAHEIAGVEVAWNWELPRTREGYYRYQGGVEAAMKRVLAYSPQADLLWLETKTPDLEQAQGFAKTIREAYPEKWLVYNLSPSFNWGAHGFTDADLRAFIGDLGRAGFVLQLISLAGLHSGAVVFSELAERYKRDGMLAYVELIQRKEKEIGCDVLTHQKWSGASYVDRVLNAVSAGSAATAASGKDSTEGQFH